MTANVLAFPSKPGVNKHGLSRHIPVDIKQEIRRSCGYGCVVCGVTITEFEHFFPDFADAEFHDPCRIALLCPTHHAEVTKNILPKEQVQEARLNPAALRTGFSRAEHPYFRGSPRIMLGSNEILCRAPLHINGVEPISVLAASDSGVADISACFQSQDGSAMLKIVNNEWRVFGGHWQFQNVANRYLFRDSDGECCLDIRIHAPDSLEIHSMNTWIGGTNVRIESGDLILPWGRFSANHFGGGDIAIFCG